MLISAPGPRPARRAATYRRSSTPSSGGGKKAIGAVAASILTAAYHMLSNGTSTRTSAPITSIVAPKRCKQTRLVNDFNGSVCRSDHSHHMISTWFFLEHGLFGLVRHRGFLPKAERFSALPARFHLEHPPPRRRGAGRFSAPKAPSHAATAVPAPPPWCGRCGRGTSPRRPRNPSKSCVRTTPYRGR